MIFDLHKTSLGVHRGWITDGYYLIHKSVPVRLVGDDYRAKIILDNLKSNMSYLYQYVLDKDQGMMKQYRKGITSTIKVRKTNCDLLVAEAIVGIETTYRGDRLGISLGPITIPLSFYIDALNYEVMKYNDLVVAFDKQDEPVMISASVCDV